MVSTILPAVGLWTVHVGAGVTTKVVPGRPLRLTGVSLGYLVVSQHQRTTLQLTYQPEGSTDAFTPTICSLVAGRIEQVSCDLVLQADREFIFNVFGENSVDLVGNYIEYDDDDEAEATTMIEFIGRKEAMQSHNIDFTVKPKDEDGDDASSTTGSLGKRKATTRKASSANVASKPAAKKSKA